LNTDIVAAQAIIHVLQALVLPYWQFADEGFVKVPISVFCFPNKLLIPKTFSCFEVKNNPMNQKHKIAQLFSPAAFIHDTEENIQAMENLVREQKIGGITFFHSRHSAAANFEKRQEILTYDNTLDKLLELINRYQQAAETPLLISIDAEFGLAMRVEHVPQYPYAISLGAMPIEAEDLVEEVGYRIGKDLRQCGIHVNFAPVADINTNPKNPVIGYRSFGTDREKVSRFAKAYYRGLKKAGLEGSFKHFPGHGDTDVDSHLGMPVIQKSKKQLMEEEIYPFVQGIKAGIGMVMVGHLAAPALTQGKNIPASISREIIRDFLKTELGFKGIVVSDALNMKAISSMFPVPGELEWKAFEAGNDLLCFSENVREGIDLIAQHAEPADIEASFQKIMALKKDLQLFDQKPVTKTDFDWEGHRALLGRLAPKFLSVVLDQGTPMSGKVAKISLQEAEQNLFFRTIDAHRPSPTLILENNGPDIPNELEDCDWVLISVFVPSAKPVNNFGLDINLLEKLSKIAATKPCALYLFGNPLALRKIPDLDTFHKIVCAFQHFPECQAAAAQHFLGLIQAEGSWELNMD
jgi:beta-glucosidase-like glycosyl hydrolase